MTIANRCSTCSAVPAVMPGSIPAGPDGSGQMLVMPTARGEATVPASQPRPWRPAAAQTDRALRHARPLPAAFARYNAASASLSIMPSVARPVAS